MLSGGGVPLRCSSLNWLSASMRGHAAWSASLLRLMPYRSGPADSRLASILGAVIELRYRRAGVDCEVRTQPYRRFRPPDLRGSSARRPRWACHCLAAPHDVRRTVSGAPAARSCGNRCGATRRDSTSGRRQPKPLVELARLRSRSQVEAADAIDHDVPGHGTFQLLRRPSDDTPAGLPKIEANRRIQASQLRYDLADRAFAEVHPDHVRNGEENLYATKVASYSKGLPHSCDQA